MKRFILGIIAIVALLLGCTPAGPAEIPVQNETEEIAVETTPSGAVVAEEMAAENLTEEDLSVPEAEITVEEVSSEVDSVVERVPESIYITLTDVGFGVPEVKIKVGETVAWKNEREGRQQKAMILGTQWCSTIVRSKLFGPGEVYRATFNKAGTCTVVDGMYTTETMKIVVEE